jgi:hypothetical protein
MTIGDGVSSFLGGGILCGLVWFVFLNERTSDVMSEMIGRFFVRVVVLCVWVEV